MSIVELSSTVDKLAKAVTQKNKELDTLKSEYNAKIMQMNSYLSTLQDIVLAENHNHQQEVTDDDFITATNGGLNCPKCSTRVRMDDFIIVPRGKIRLLAEKSEPLRSSFEKLNLEGTSATTNTNYATTTNTTPKYSPSKDSSASPHTDKKHQERRSSKVICSYCQKPGHTRAKCFARLNAPMKNA
ncbi:hypothetical protein CLIB1423_01S10264 [[Candida] railenensis]|uniref:Uncharacterized protein n=1 Tax=[Candida] railenensis TaxID=45579 RepID=A0A9P0VVX1_9ASCO|nr:hypothetical protein CLIB1423_01S10264 [[Candida] railenensis]